MARKQFSHERLRLFFIYLGHKYNLLEATINKANLPNSSDELQKIKLLTEEVA